MRAPIYQERPAAFELFRAQWIAGFQHDDLQQDQVSHATVTNDRTLMLTVRRYTSENHCLLSSMPPVRNVVLVTPDGVLGPKLEPVPGAASVAWYGVSRRGVPVSAALYICCWRSD
jgi:hypothetical protein